MKVFEVLAETTKINPADVPGISTEGADGIVIDVLNTAYFIAGIAAIIVIVIAGLLYTISDGDSAKVTRAKNAIVYAVVGLIIVLSAFVITGFILGRF